MKSTATFTKREILEVLRGLRRAVGACSRLEQGAIGEDSVLKYQQMAEIARGFQRHLIEQMSKSEDNN